MLLSYNSSVLTKKKSRVFLLLKEIRELLHRKLECLLPNKTRLFEPANPKFYAPAIQPAQSSFPDTLPETRASRWPAQPASWRHNRDRCTSSPWIRPRHRPCSSSSSSSSCRATAARSCPRPRSRSTAP